MPFGVGVSQLVRVAMRSVTMIVLAIRLVREDVPVVKRSFDVVGQGRAD